MGLDLGGNGAKSALATINHTILGLMLKDGIELVHGYLLGLNLYADWFYFKLLVRILSANGLLDSGRVV